MAGAEGVGSKRTRKLGAKYIISVSSTAGSCDHIFLNLGCRPKITRGISLIVIVTAATELYGNPMLGLYNTEQTDLYTVEKLAV